MTDRPDKLACGLFRFDSSDADDRWPITYSGWVEGIDSSYDFDDALNALVPERLKGRVQTDSESEFVYVYAADEEAAAWVERAADAISERLTAPVPTMRERLAGLEID
jgi:hypothetical protein